MFKSNSLLFFNRDENKLEKEIDRVKDKIIEFKNLSEKIQQKSDRKEIEQCKNMLNDVLQSFDFNENNINLGV